MFLKVTGKTVLRIVAQICGDPRNRHIGIGKQNHGIIHSVFREMSPDRFARLVLECIVNITAAVIRRGENIVDRQRHDFGLIEPGKKSLQPFGKRGYMLNLVADIKAEQLEHDTGVIAFVVDDGRFFQIEPIELFLQDLQFFYADVEV